MTNSAALFRAHNIQILDYPLEGAVASALSVCDEAIIVTQPSADDTMSILLELCHRWGQRVQIVQHSWKYDRGWQEEVWNVGADHTDADWLMYHDADEAVLYPELARSLMLNPDNKLIRFPFVHLYGTNHFEHAFPLTHNTRLGRRSAGYRMRNWCTDEHPTRAACQMVYGPDEENAHIPCKGVGMVDIDTPILHYGWCRDAKALAISQSKLKAWYQDGGGLEDGHIPDVKPYPFRLAERLKEGKAKRYTGPHPDYMAGWFARHEQQWKEIEQNV